MKNIIVCYVSLLILHTAIGCIQEYDLCGCKKAKVKDTDKQGKRLECSQINIATMFAEADFHKDIVLHTMMLRENNVEEVSRDTFGSRPRSLEIFKQVLKLDLSQNKIRRIKWKAVAKVSQLFVHPIKSCRGLTMESIDCCKHGVVIPDTYISDRCFLVVQDDGNRVSPHKYPTMIFIKATPQGKDKLLLEAPGMDPLLLAIPKYDSHSRITNHSVLGEDCSGIDCGPESAEWMKKYLKEDGLRLVYHDPELPVTLRKKLMKHTDLDVYSDEPVCSVFQNFSPFNLASEASLQELNSKHEKSVSMRNFRPNVVVKGCSPFEEDMWRHLKIGNAEFRFAKYGNRCPLTTIDPETGVKSEDSHPLSTLRTFRLCKPEEKKLYGNSPRFSVDFIVVKPGVIGIDDTVYASQ